MRGVSGEASPENSAESEAAVSGKNIFFPCSIRCATRRHKLCFVLSAQARKTHSTRCSSSPQKVLRLSGVSELWAYQLFLCKHTVMTAQS